MTWVTDTTPIELLLLGCAFVLSAVIGLERERRFKSAGLRTHTLVGIGSALFTLVSAYGFAPLLSEEVVLDPSRIAAQIVSGVGFLGAGVIFVRQNAVAGLTTAASIWVTAAVGMACGAGMPLIALATTLLHLVTVILLTGLGRRLRASRRDRVFLVQYKEGTGALRGVLSTVGGLGFTSTVIGLATIERPGKARRVDARILLPNARADADQLVETLSRIRGVVSVRATEPDND